MIFEKPLSDSLSLQIVFLGYFSNPPNSQLAISAVIAIQDSVLLLPLSSAAFGDLEQLRCSRSPKEWLLLGHCELWRMI
jgi:hypothetical protein